MNMSWKFPKMLNENLIIDFKTTMGDCQGHQQDHSIPLSSQNNCMKIYFIKSHFTSSTFSTRLKLFWDLALTFNLLIVLYRAFYYSTVRFLN